MSFTRRTAALFIVAAGLTAAHVGAASAATIAEPSRATPVDADRSSVVWSDYDETVKAFRLMIRAPGGTAHPLPVTPSPVPFDADLGDDAQRHRVVAYTACPSGPTSCDVHVIRVSDGHDEAVPAASRPGVREHSPTVSRGRLVWAASGEAFERPRVLLLTLGTTGAPSELPGLPRRRCGEDYRGRFACRTVYGRIGGLELRGSTLAQAVQTRLDRGLDNAGQGELRVVDIKRRTSEQVLSFGTGEAGQALIGLSIDANELYAYKACFGDPSGCNERAGTLRYRFDNGRLELAEDSHQLSGFTVDRGRVVVADGTEQHYCEIEQGDYPGLQNVKTGPCPIEERALPTRWTRVRRR
jgi:hypothetical protein